MMASMVLLLSLIAGVGTVTVIQDPPFLNLSAGGTARMSCDVKNVKVGVTVNHSWNLQGSWENLENSSRMTVTPNSLTISSVTPNDSGRYICTVRDNDLYPYNGKGTHLSVTALTTLVTPSITQYRNESSGNDYLYLYSLIPLILLCLVAILSSRCAARRGSQTPSAERRDVHLQTSTQANDAGDLHYSTILHHPSAGQRRERERNGEKRTDVVEYAPVRIATPRQPFTCDSTDKDLGNVCYASLRMSTVDIRPMEKSATYPDLE